MAYIYILFEKILISVMCYFLRFFSDVPRLLQISEMTNTQKNYVTNSKT